MNNNIDRIKSLIRNIPDYPKPGIIFRDITSLLNDRNGFSLIAEEIHRILLMQRDLIFNKVVAIEARGFIFGTLLAEYSYTPLVLARKSGKLPGEVVEIEYGLEYGKDSLCLQKTDIKRGDEVIICDDLLATGGTAKAVCDLVEKLGGKITECYFLIELDDLEGRKVLEDKGIKVISSIHY